MSDGMRFETVAIHVGQDPDPTTGAAIVPIYQTSTYIQAGVGDHKGYEYSRTDNPTRRALEVCMAGLEEAAHGIAFASGMAALTSLALAFGSGRKVLIPDDVYGGTFRLFDKVLKRYGLDYASVDMADIDAVESACTDDVAMVVAETPTNPLLKVLDLEALAGVAHAARALLVVDNTFATPYIQRPLQLGADVVVYSATKYLGGHSDLVAGVITLNDDDLAAQLRFLQNAVGAVPGPLDCWLLLRGLKTLAIRMQAHSANAVRVAEWLAGHPKVRRVHFPGSPDFPRHDVATRQMSAAGKPLYGGMVSFEAMSEKDALNICSRTELFWLGESLGGVESLIEHPAQMTHFSLAGSGMEVPPELIRLSVGIEHADDLIADLDRALAAG